MNEIKVIAFDADDTLWVNEPYFQEVEHTFCELLSGFLPVQEISKELFKTEMSNLSLYGYGVKSFTLSMVETALRVGEGRLSPEMIGNIVGMGKSLLEKPIELLDGVEHILATLSGKYRLVLATKGDLLDQQRKLNGSGLRQYFHHVEIMHDKNEDEYRKLLHNLSVNSNEFIMVGNSLKSDILPVVSIGAKAAYVPFHTTWAHETVSSDKATGGYYEFSKLTGLLDIL